MKYKLFKVILSNGKVKGYRIIDSSGRMQDKSTDEIRELLINHGAEIDGFGINKNLELQIMYNPDSVEYVEELKVSNIFLTDQELDNRLLKLRGYDKRKQYIEIMDWLDKAEGEKILGLYGLRRTGKTVLMLQVAEELRKQGIRVAYGEVRRNNSENELISALSELVSHNYSVILIDEITADKEFLSYANILSDRFSSIKTKIIVAGTQSFILDEASRNILFDRIDFIHTTFISFREFHRIMGECTILDYIRFGGVLSGSRDKNDSETYYEYIQSSIIDNIKHTLSYYTFDSKWKAIDTQIKREEFDTLISIFLDTCNIDDTINRVNKTYKSSHLGSAADLYNSYARKHKLEGVKRLTKEDISLLQNHISVNLKLYDIGAGRIDTIRAFLYEIVGVLIKLDVLMYRRTFVGKESIDDLLFVQPGLRYKQIMYIIDILYKEVLGSLDGIDILKQKLLEDIEGRLIEEALIVNWQKLYPEYRVYRYTEFGKEIDIVVENNKGELALFEVKRSSIMYPEGQARWLIDNSIQEGLEHQGRRKIQTRYVLYNGDNNNISYNGYMIRYRNITDFMLSWDRE